MSTPIDQLWNLLAAPTIDPRDLAGALGSVVREPDLDYRTVQLVYEARQALGPRCSGLDAEIQVHCQHVGLDTSDVKFPRLKERLVSNFRPEQVRQYLRDLGTQLRQPVSMTIGGSVAITLQGLSSRPTDDVDIVDEVPPEIRQQRQLISQLAHQYGIQPTHFQSHYLPDGWEGRVKSLGSFGQLQVSVVDAYDILAGKVYSLRSKDRDDLRRLAPEIDQSRLLQRLRIATQRLWRDDRFRQQAVQNWYVVYGEPLDLTSA